MSPDISHLLSLIGLTFLLGLRHGMDPDHLAMVDNLTRYNVQAAPRVARWCGAWFSLGHGVLVMGVAAGLALLSGEHVLPHWLEATGQLPSPNVVMSSTPALEAEDVVLMVMNPSLLSIVRSVEK